MIFCANPKAQFETRRAKILGAIEDVLASGSYILGANVSAFERDMASRL